MMTPLCPRRWLSSVISLLPFPGIGLNRGWDCCSGCSGVGRWCRLWNGAVDYLIQLVYRQEDPESVGQFWVVSPAAESGRGW